MHLVFDGGEDGEQISRSLDGTLKYCLGKERCRGNGAQGPLMVPWERVDIGDGAGVEKQETIGRSHDLRDWGGK